MFLQKAMKQGRNVHSISHVMHAHKVCGHIVWVTCLLPLLFVLFGYILGYYSEVAIQSCIEPYTCFKFHCIIIIIMPV